MHFTIWYSSFLREIHEHKEWFNVRLVNRPVLYNIPISWLCNLGWVFNLYKSFSNGWKTLNFGCLKKRKASLIIAPVQDLWEVHHWKWKIKQGMTYAFNLIVFLFTVLFLFIYLYCLWWDKSWFSTKVWTFLETFVYKVYICNPSQK